MKYCALCCIAKDEDYYIEEWVDYHLLLGFDTIILYDNHSLVSLKEILKNNVESGAVIVHDTQEDFLGTKAQGLAYTHCFKTYADDFVWIAVIDADEIIMLHRNRSIKSFLAEYENYGGVLLNWVHYANPMMTDRGSKSMIKNFVYRENKRFTVGKSIVRPKRVAEFTGPHGPKYQYPYYAVNTEHFPLEPCTYSAPYCTDVAQINHYYLRTKHDYQLKIDKWKKANLKLSPAYDEMIKNYTVFDNSADLFYESLKNNKAKPRLPLKLTSQAELTNFFLDIVKIEPDLERLEIWLSDYVCKFSDEPLLWLFRSMLAREKRNPNQALHFIKQAFKFSGTSTLYYELSKVYEMLGDEKRKLYALEQANYKKNIENTTCA